MKRFEHIGATFHFQGAPVGAFNAEALPREDGDHEYEPYRGPGHLQMQETLRAGKQASCYYVHEDEKILFTVIACPTYGVLTLSNVRTETNAP
ncbi:MAG TPA: hypothetical protein VFK92_12255 [Burkholderiales bacterium]|nr:hypothetical protein [Burkholderiales bacterium]